MAHSGAPAAKQAAATARLELVHTLGAGIVPSAPLHQALDALAAAERRLDARHREVIANLVSTMRLAASRVVAAQDAPAGSPEEQAVAATVLASNTDVVSAEAAVLAVQRLGAAVAKLAAGVWAVQRAQHREAWMWAPRD